MFTLCVFMYFFFFSFFYFFTCVYVFVCLEHDFIIIMHKLLYPSIRVRTAPPVSVRVRTRVSASFSFTVLHVSRGLLR